uniref:Uncharacterized protein LOC114336797 isoform X1 n=1 Tax=Diabrotica virgifera virgifera TaxID=50390 RepID=A0A6P7G7M8_DIAVI
MQCHQCRKNFSSTSTLNRHKRKVCGKRHMCSIPGKKRRMVASEPLSRNVSKIHHVFKSRIVSYRITDEETLDYKTFMKNVQPASIQLIEQEVEKHATVKINMEVFAVYVIPEKDMSDIKSMNTKNKLITICSDLNNIFKDFTDEIFNKASEFQEKESNWALQEILFLDININRCALISGKKHLKLPLSIIRKHAVLNIQNNDDACFFWCIMAALFPREGNPVTPDSYPDYKENLNLDNIEVPMKLKDISKFEVMNNISVNVFGLETYYKEKKMYTEVVGPLHFTSRKMPTHVNLLLLSNDIGESHYCLIKNLSRLVTSQKTKHKEATYICNGCLLFFKTVEKLNQHEQFDCNHTCTEMPTCEPKINKFGERIMQNILKFENIQNQLSAPFVVYADFESLLKPIHHNEPLTTKSFTVQICEHEPHSFALYFKCTFNEKYSKYFSYRGTNVSKVFIQKLEEMVHYVYNNHLKNIRDMLPLTPDEKMLSKKSKCHICEKEFKVNDVRVYDHCHMTGRFRGIAHQVCNLNFQLPHFIPVFLHNLTNYDCHMFIKNLTTSGEKVTVLAQNKEKYITFSKSILVEKFPNMPAKLIQLRFVDSFRFLPKSLDKLSKTLKPEQCREVRKYFPNEEQFKLIRQKGVFPYSYITCTEKLHEEVLPKKEDFYNTLLNEAISDEDYQRACVVWQTFNCKTLGDYSDIYLKSDVLLLADIFENFREVCLDNYKLDPARYITAPSFSWDAMLRMTQVELELITDIDIFNFFKKGIRGGICQCCKEALIPKAISDRYM